MPPAMASPVPTPPVLLCTEKGRYLSPAATRNTLQLRGGTKCHFGWSWVRSVPISSTCALSFKIPNNSSRHLGSPWLPSPPGVSSRKAHDVLASPRVSMELPLPPSTRTRTGPWFLVPGGRVLGFSASIWVLEWPFVSSLDLPKASTWPALSGYSQSSWLENKEIFDFSDPFQRASQRSNGVWWIGKREGQYGQPESSTEGSGQLEVRGPKWIIIKGSAGLHSCWGP